MAYDPSLPTTRDEARKRLGDVKATELLSDVDYDTELALHADWRSAAAVLARGLAARAINDPTSFTAVGDVSTSWANRAAEWRLTAKELDAEVAAANASAGGPGTISYLSTPFLTLGGDEEW